MAKARRASPTSSTELVLCSISRMYASETQLIITRVLMKYGWLSHDIRGNRKLFVLMDHIFPDLAVERSTVDSRWMELYAVRRIPKNVVNHEGGVITGVGSLDRELALAKDRFHRRRSTSLPDSTENSAVTIPQWVSCSGALNLSIPYT